MDGTVERKCYISPCIDQPRLSYAAVTNNLHILLTYYSQGLPFVCIKSIVALHLVLFILDQA